MAGRDWRLLMAIGATCPFVHRHRKNNPVFSVSHKCTVERTYGTRAALRQAPTPDSPEASRTSGIFRNKRICSRLRRSPHANAVGVSKSVCYFGFARLFWLPYCRDGGLLLGFLQAHKIFTKLNPTHAFTFPAISLGIVHPFC